MALSNMLKEPRREITETVIGVLCVAAFLWVDVYCTDWLREHGKTGSDPYLSSLVLTGVCMVVGMLLLWLGAMFIHSIGEGVCNWFERGGVHIRPRNRR